MTVPTPAVPCAQPAEPSTDGPREGAVTAGTDGEIATIRASIEQCVNNAEKARLFQRMAQLQEGHGDLSAAIDALLGAYRCDARNGDITGRLADLYFDTGQWRLARDWLQRLVDHSPGRDDLHKIYFRIGWAHEQSGDRDRAFSYYAQSFTRDPQYEPTLECLLVRCYARRQWQNTLRIATVLLDHYADRRSPRELADLHVQIALCELHLALRAVAVAALKRLVLPEGASSFSPEEAWEEIASCWAAWPLDPHLLPEIDKQARARAILALRNALNEVPAHSVALQALGALMLCSEDWDRAVRYLERAAECEENDVALQASLLGCAGEVAYRRLGSMQLAATFSQRAGGDATASALREQRVEVADRVLEPEGRVEDGAEGSSPATRL